MAIEMLFGAGSGALHAVTGPDHVLSLGPMALGSGRSSWRLGARWGAGHALGTLLLCVPVLWLAQRAHLPFLASIGDRLAGVALLATALASFVQARRHALVEGAASTRNAVVVGFIHGLTGAASLLLVIPMLAGGSLPSSLVFLLAFAAGSTAAMALLTSLLAHVGSRVSPHLARRGRYLACAASTALGLFWLLSR